MSHRYLAKLAASHLPLFVTAPSKLRRLRQLAAVGHVEARFYPPQMHKGQFGEVLALTPAGRTMLDARASRESRSSYFGGSPLSE